MCVSCAVVNVDCDAPERGDFGGELVEAGVVLPCISSASIAPASLPSCEVRCRCVLFALVGLGHGCGECVRLGGGCVVWGCAKNYNSGIEKMCRWRIGRLGRWVSEEMFEYCKPQAFAMHVAVTLTMPRDPAWRMGFSASPRIWGSRGHNLVAYCITDSDRHDTCDQLILRVSTAVVCIYDDVLANRTYRKDHFQFPISSYWEKLKPAHFF